jgi:hypothetical protein
VAVSIHVLADDTVVPLGGEWLASAADPRLPGDVRIEPDDAGGWRLGAFHTRVEMTAVDGVRTSADRLADGSVIRIGITRMVLRADAPSERDTRLPGATLRDLDSGIAHRLVGGVRFPIGRGADCSVQLDHPSVARTHALVIFDSGRWQVLDRGSLHGTLIAGRRITRQEPLLDGTELGIGRFRLRFETEGRPPRVRETIADEAFARWIGAMHTAIPTRDRRAAFMQVLLHADRPDRAALLAGAVQGLLAADEVAIRAHAAAALALASSWGGMPKPDAAALLAPLLADADHAVQTAAATALARLDPLAASRQLVRLAIHVLDGKLPVFGQEQVLDVACALRHADADALEELRDRAEAVARESLQAALRARAAVFLGEIAAAGSAPAYHVLEAMRAHKTATIRGAAFEALARARVGR